MRADGLAATAAFRFLALCVAGFAVALVLGCAIGCAPAQQGGSQPSGSASSTASGAQSDHEKVEVRLVAPTALEGVLRELQDAYAADKSWLTFEGGFYAGQLERAMEIGLPVALDDVETEAATASNGQAPASADSAVSDMLSAVIAAAPGGQQKSSSSSSASETDGAPFIPTAELVFESSPEAMGELEQVGAVDAATRLDMLEGYLVLAAGSDSAITSATTAELQAGLYRMAVLSPEAPDAARPLQVLSSLGLYADGAFAGALAPAAASGAAEGASAAGGSGSSSSAAASGAPAADAAGQARVRLFDSTAELFAALATDPNLVAIVSVSDLYRYGGTKAIGWVPPESYPAIRYPAALTVAVEAADGEGKHPAAARDAARDFLNWMVSDEDAGRIIEKWGFRLAA